MSTALVAVVTSLAQRARAASLVLANAPTPAKNASLAQLADLELALGQFALALLITVFLVFPLLGRTYDAAVIAAGFSGFTLGSTPTAMANMTAVAQKFGPAPKAFIVLPP